MVLNETSVIQMKTSSLLAAILTLGSALPGKGEDLQALYAEAREDFTRGRYAEAKPKLQKVAAASPDLIPARAMLAEILLMEKQREARPAALKLAEKTAMREVRLSGVTVMEGLELARLEISKASGGKVKAEIFPRIPEASQEVVLSMRVKGMTIQHFVDAVAWAGGAKASYDERGMVVLPLSDSPAAGPSSAARARRAAAEKIVIPQIAFEGAKLEDVIAWLEMQGEKLSPANAPTLVQRALPQDKLVTLNLRNIPLHEALRMVGMVADVVVEYHDWGIGVAPVGTAGGQSQTAGAPRTPGSAEPAAPGTGPETKKPDSSP